MRAVLLLMFMAASSEGQFQAPFLNRLHKQKVRFFKKTLGKKNWESLQETLNADFSMADILHYPLRLSDYWPFMLLDEHPGIEPQLPNESKPVGDDEGYCRGFSALLKDRGAERSRIHGI